MSLQLYLGLGFISFLIIWLVAVVGNELVNITKYLGDIIELLNEIKNKN